MHSIIKTGIAAVILATTLALTGAPQTFAGEAEAQMLDSFVGNWRGNSVLTGGDEPEDFTCRMAIANGTGTKINFAGRCSLVGMNLAVNGTVSYNEENQRFEGAMTSNTAYSGLAVGRVRGDDIVFDFRRRNLDESGRDLSIGSVIVLGDDQITVEFEVTFNESGDQMNASVPFHRS